MNRIGTLSIFILIIAASLAFNLHRNKQQYDLSKIQIRHEESQIAEDDKIYVVILDAGSSSTKLNILYWKNRELQDLDQYEKVYMKGSEWRKGPGIQKMKTNEELTVYLKQFLDKAKSVIPEQKIKSTFIMLGATAGLRLASKEDQDRILDHSRKMLKDSGFRFVKDSWCRMLTDAEEGISLWLSINYLLGNIHEEKQDKTATVIDIGGASTQTAFYYGGSCEQSDLEIKLQFSETHKFSVYGVSFLNYGKDRAQENIIRKLVQDNLDTKEIKFPCFYEGYKGPWNIDPKITLIGTSDPYQCYKLIENYLQGMIDPVQLKEKAKCETDYTLRPPKNQQAFGVSNVRFAADAVKLGDTFRLQELRSRAETLCSMNWAQAVIDQGDTPYSPSSCFLALFSSSVAIDGYKTNPLEVFYSPKVIGEVEPGWGLGYIILNFNKAYQECQKKIFEGTSDAKDDDCGYTDLLIEKK